MVEFKLDLKSGVPFHRQIVDQIRYGIASDRLMPGEQLPTVRALAVHLQVNPNTVRKAYSELEILGILDTQQGTGTFVSHQQVEIGEDEKEEEDLHTPGLIMNHKAADEIGSIEDHPMSMISEIDAQAKKDLDLINELCVKELIVLKILDKKSLEQTERGVIEFHYLY